MTEREKIKLINKNGGRYLANFAPEEITEEMCWAAVRRNVTAIDFVPKHFRTPHLLKWCIAACPDVFARFPREDKTEEICYTAVNHNGMLLQYVPAEQMTLAVVKEAVANKQTAYRFIPACVWTPAFTAKLILACTVNPPAELCTVQFYTGVVEADPKTFMFIPDKFHTAELCLAAMRRMGYATVAEMIEARPDLCQSIHPSLYDHDACATALLTDKFLPLPPPNIKKYPDLWPEAVKRIKYFLSYIPKKKITRELCEASLDKEPASFMYVPEKFRDDAMCKKAFALNKENILYIPVTLYTPEMAAYARTRLEDTKKQLAEKKRKLARELPPKLLSEIPVEKRTLEVCKKALRKGTGDPEDVPPEYMDKDFALWMVQNMRSRLGTNEYLDHVPENLRDADVCMAAVQRAGVNLAFVPEELKTHEICLAAARQSVEATPSIPKDRFTPDVVLAVAEHGIWGCFAMIPKEKLTSEACKALFRNWRKTRLTNQPLGEIPASLFDQELCDLAVRAETHNFWDVPREYVTEDMFIFIAQKDPWSLLWNKDLPERFLDAAFLLNVLKQAPHADEALHRLAEKYILGNYDNNKVILFHDSSREK